MAAQTLHRKKFLLHLLEREESKRPMLVKEPAQEIPTKSIIEQLSNEYAISRHLIDCAGVRSVQAIEGSQSHPVLLLEYIQGKTIHELVQSSTIALPQKLHIAAEATAILGRVHKKGITHNDINSYNILVADDGLVYLIDFGMATRMKREIVPIVNEHDIFIETLAYNSPEQTGRMNRAVDYRTDLYSLGVTLYEFFTGQPPFQTDDALAMLHSHIALNPAPPHRLDPKIPKAISDIIQKLMAKNAEDRYQSAIGLQSDLEHCHKQLQTTGQIKSFVPGKNDFSDRLQISQKLYGRETEVETILSVFDHVRDRTELLLIAGYSGIGKTSLVREVYKPIIANRGIFIEGKSDQYQRNAPYSAWAEAFNRLVNGWLAESDAEISRLRTAILNAVGDNGQILINLIPNLINIIGPQPELDSVEGNQAQNRFDYFFQRFINVIATPEQPLVVFLDDLQWIDLASLSLMKRLLMNPDSRNFLLIGAFRDNEVDNTHPLTLGLSDLEKAGAKVNLITLDNLTQEDTLQLLADSLHAPLDSCSPLAQLLHGKTGGNAFFLKRYLLDLEEEGWLWFDYNSRSWRWDLAELRNLAISDNVADLMVKKIDKLPKATQEGLKLAACLGNEFELGLFRQIKGIPEKESQENFYLAIQDGLLERFKDSYKFAHDQIKQAAYSTILDSEKARLHYQIGQTLLQQIPQAAVKYSFDAVNHLNLAIPLMQSNAKRVELVELNLIAAQDAMKAAAFHTVEAYALIAVDLMGANGWQDHYGLMHELHQLATEAAYLTKEFESSLQYTNTMLAKSQSLLDQLPATIMLIRLYHAQNKMEEAINTGLTAVMDLRFELRSSAPPGLSVEAISNLPLMSDPMAVAAMDLLENVHHSAYLAQFDQFSRMVNTALHIMLEFGVHPASSMFVSMYAAFIWREDIDEACRFGELSLHLADKFSDNQNLASVKIAFATLIQHWKSHYRNLEGELRSGLHMGLASGERVIASSSLTTHSFMTFFTASQLDEIQETMTKNLELQQKIGEAYPARSILIWAQFVSNLRGFAADPFELDGEYFSYARDLPLSQAAKLSAVTFYRYCLKMVLHFHLGKYSSAYDNSIEAEPFLPEFVAHLAFSFFIFYQSLTILQLLDGQDRHTDLNKKLEVNLAKIRTWAEHAPMNQQHRLDLLLAERARIDGNVAMAIDHYESAIIGARDNEYIREEALANELYGRFWQQRGNHNYARVNLREAHALYNQWGAVIIVDHLETLYPQWLRIEEIEPDRTPSSMSPSNAYRNLDIGSILKASQAISGEIDLNQLLDKMMKIVMENAGAERAFLVFKGNGMWRIAARAEGRHSETQVMNETIVGNNDLLADKIVNYVARTRKTVVLEDAFKKGDFVSDPHIRQHRVKSALCIPLINQGETSAVLYLENNLSSGVFTPERLELLQLLSSQMAISIDNARAHDQLEKLLEERSKALSSAEAQIRSLFDNSPMGIALSTYDGQFMTVNKALLNLMRISEEELMQRGVSDFYADPADRKALLAKLQESGSVQDFGIQFVRNDGEVFYGSVNMSQLVLEGNDVWLTLLEDVTEEITAEQEAATIQERERLARELHDAVTQTLFSASVLAQASPRMMKKNPAIAQRNFKRLEMLINGALAEMRTLLLELRPDRLREQDISQLFGLLVESIRARTRANISLTIEKSFSPPEDVAIFLYRIAQEALNNVARHAMASKVIIELSGDDENIKLSIKDDGSGFDLREIPAGHFGISIMQERAKSIGAKMEIVSHVGAGTELIVSWPAPGKENKDE